MRIKPLLLYFVLIVSCNLQQGRRISLLNNSEMAFDKNGRVRVRIQNHVKTFVQYNTIDELSNMLYHTPKGKIDSIIKNNQDWQFVFYCKCALADSCRLMAILDRYDCCFPVIIDSEDQFLISNGYSLTYSEIGMICTENGLILGVSSIGTRQSFFDEKFERAKRSLR